MAYAALEDIESRYNDVVLPMMENPENPDEEIVDDGAVAQALDDAAAEIDPYLQVKHNLPLTEVPDLLVRLSVDIALYRMPLDAVGNTDERRKRYEDAVKTLERIAGGGIALGIAETEETPSGGVSVSGPGRLFSRDSMAGVL